MDFEQLLKFVDVESKRLKKHYGEYPDKEKEALAMAVKLQEELGELCQEILFHYSLQGKHKADKFNKENLPNEFADVILITLILAKKMNIDIKKALSDKTKKIENRYRK